MFFVFSVTLEFADPHNMLRVRVITDTAEADLMTPVPHKGFSVAELQKKNICALELLNNTETIDQMTVFREEDPE